MSRVCCERPSAPVHQAWRMVYSQHHHADDERGFAKHSSIYRTTLSATTCFDTATAQPFLVRPANGMPSPCPYFVYTHLPSINRAKGQTLLFVDNETGPTRPAWANTTNRNTPPTGDSQDMSKTRRSETLETCRLGVPIKCRIRNRKIFTLFSRKDSKIMYQLGSDSYLCPAVLSYQPLNIN